MRLPTNFFFRYILKHLESVIKAWGKAEIEMEISYSGEPFDIAFNPAFILDYLKSVGEEKFIINMIDGEKPAMLKDSTDYIYIVMPVSVG